MLPDLTREAARRFGDSPAIVAEERWALSYAELDRVSDEVAMGLSRRGVSAGDVVALALPTIPEYLVSYLAVAKLGGVTTGVNARLSAPERHAVLAIARPSLVLATADLAPDGTDLEVVEIEAAASAGALLASLRVGDEAPPALAADDQRAVAIVFTSGTTGTPKGALFRNRQLAAVTAIDVGDRWGGGGRSLAGTSLAHLGPMTKLAGSLRLGGTMFLTRRWRADDALRRVQDDRLTTFGGIPTQLALMLAVPDFDRLDLSGIRAVIIGGGPATPALVREARARIAAPLAVRYSCTEAAIGVGTAFDDPEEDAEITVGRPQRGIELAILDDDDRPVEPGAVGNVCLRSAAVMSEYYRDPETTAAVFTADGFVRTGDLGWVDDRGRLRLSGRAKEMYVRGGYNVYPAEVEAVLAEHAAVAAISVVARQDHVMGELGVAFVVARQGHTAPTLSDLRDFGSGRLAGYKLPDDIRVVDALPLTAMDKVDRRALAARAEQP